MTIRTGTLAVAISLVASGAALAGNDYAFVDANSNRQPLWSNMAQCDNDVYNEPCESLANCSGTTLYASQSGKYAFYAVYNSGGTVYVYYSGSSTVACTFSQ